MNTDKESPAKAKGPGKGQPPKTENFYTRTTLIQLNTIEKKGGPTQPHQ